VLNKVQKSVKKSSCLKYLPHADILFTSKAIYESKGDREGEGDIGKEVIVKTGRGR
jgi:hypothetical protein